jgi:hypothetical protein
MNGRLNHGINWVVTRLQSEPQLQHYFSHEYVRVLIEYEVGMRICTCTIINLIMYMIIRLDLYNISQLQFIVSNCSLLFSKFLTLEYVQLLKNLDTICDVTSAESSEEGVTFNDISLQMWKTNGLPLC